MTRLLLLVLLSLPAAVLAQRDVALIDLVSGEVSYASGKAAPAKATAFMKVREGDRFTVSRGGQVRLLYFQGAQQEHYAGPASFTAGREASKVQSGSKPRVTKVPSVVSSRVARIPELVENARLGGVQLRGKPPAKADEALREARALYTKLRSAAPKDDITPELYLYATLSDYHRTDEMKAVVDEMLRRQPDNEEVKVLAASVRSQPGGVK